MQRRQFIVLAVVRAATPPIIHSQSRWQPDGVASIARIGVLTPDDDPVPESEVGTLAPKGVSVHGSRVPWNHDVSSFVEHAPAAAEMVARMSPRVILYAFTSSSYALGVGRDEELTATLEKRVGGIPVISTCNAAVEAFRFLRVRRIALVHPPWFTEDISRKGMEYFRAHGMDVVYCDRITPARAFTEVSPAEVYDWVAANAPREAEVIFIGGNGLRAIGVIHALEDKLHKPVLTANQVLVWDVLRLLKISSKPNGYGVLFSNNGAAR